eukprot:TRINITY_DN70078_c0_g1_i1.p1 TRINITY_DN70078_c0_g1~~TRINITY_DN70078_c0_g1_i1.p1  ORF type:complete len:497 (+),score=96.65 TRINITY_DN70078_c0_g1_i1:89-1579(+)
MQVLRTLTCGDCGASSAAPTVDTLDTVPSSWGSGSPCELTPGSESHDRERAGAAAASDDGPDAEWVIVDPPRHWPAHELAAASPRKLATPVSSTFLGFRLLDQSQPQCAVCGTSFSLWNRRHWCRNCARIICLHCGQSERTLWTGGPTVRVCALCAAPAVLRLHRDLLLGQVFAYLSTAELQTALCVCRAFNNPVHLPYPCERHAHVTDLYGPSVHFLERGSSASVYAGADRRSDRKVALKVVNKQAVKLFADYQQLLREVELHRSMRHPHVVRVDRVLQTPHHLYLAMELAQGDLFQWLTASRRVPEVHALQLGEQLFGALAYLHDRCKVVHRDVKLENLLTFPPQPGSAVPVIKLCDFGYARRLPPGGDAVPVAPCGTTLYFAPEVVRASEDRPPGRCLIPIDAALLPKLDLFSAGVVMHFLLRRREPFCDPVSEAPRGLQWPAADSPALGAGASALTRALVGDLLSAEPAARPTAAAAAARAAQAAAAAGVPR